MQAAHWQQRVEGQFPHCPTADRLTHSYVRCNNNCNDSICGLGFFMKRFFSLLSLLVLAACAPAPIETLPTLARLPTETAGPDFVILNQTEAAELRSPLPATFTPTPSLTALPPSITPS